jgi:hypothetical protein
VASILSKTTKFQLSKQKSKYKIIPTIKALKKIAEIIALILQKVKGK